MSFEGGCISEKESRHNNHRNQVALGNANVNNIKPITAAYKPSPKTKEIECKPPPHIKRPSATRAHDIDVWRLPAEARASIGSGGQPARRKSDRLLGTGLRIR